MTPSREARAHEALALLSAVSEAYVHAVTPTDEMPVSPSVAALSKGEGYRTDALALGDTDGGTARVFAEAYTAAVMYPPSAAYQRARADTRVLLRKDATTVPLDGLGSAVMTEAGTARRDALVAAGETAANKLRPQAMGVVDAARTVRDTLGEAMTLALGTGDAGTDTVFAASDEVFRELDARMLRVHGFDRTKLSWADRLRSLSTMALTTLIPPATWVSVAGRWMERTDLPAARRIRSVLEPASGHGTGVMAFSSGSNGAVVWGRPTTAGVGLLDVAGALGEALMYATARGVTPSMGGVTDPTMVGLGRSLGRRLLLNRHFVRREAGLDPSERERAMLEAMYVDVAMTRMDAALARFGVMVLGRSEDLSGRYVEAVAKAMGAAPSPGEAVHTATRVFGPDGRWGARIAGALTEPVMEQWLKDRYDEDWFRNPRTGAGISAAFADMRALGMAAWREGVSGVDAGILLARRWADALHDAQRVKA